MRPLLFPPAHFAGPPLALGCDPVRTLLTDPGLTGAPSMSRRHCMDRCSVLMKSYLFHTCTAWAAPGRGGQGGDADLKSAQPCACRRAVSKYIPPALGRGPHP
eukprot:151275-Chlamydomonas_euryale.AAC.2